MQTIRRWAVPIAIPRWWVVLANALFVLLGIVLAVAGSPSINNATPNGYLEPYGILIAVCAGVALIGSTHSSPKFEVVEMVGALLLFSLLSLYVISTVGPALAGNLGRAAGAVIVTICSLLVAARGFTLLTAVLVRWAARRNA